MSSLLFGPMLNQNNPRIELLRVRWMEKSWLSVNSQRNLQRLVYSGWLTFPTLNSPDSRMEGREGFTSALPVGCLELQELGWPQELACGGRQKNQSAVEWTSHKHRHNPGPHGPHSERVEPLMAWHILHMGEFMETKFH